MGKNTEEEVLDPEAGTQETDLDNDDTQPEGEDEEGGESGDGETDETEGWDEDAASAEDEDSVEIIVDGKPRTLTASQVAEGIRAQQTLTELRQTHKQKLDEFSRVKSELAELQKRAGINPDANSSTSMSGEDFNITEDDLQDTSLLVAKMSRMAGEIVQMRKKLEDASDPAKIAQTVEAEGFRRQVREAIQADPMLKRMKPEAADAFARSAIAWAIEVNDTEGREVYTTPAQAIAGYKESLGIAASTTPTGSVDRKIRKITKMLKDPSETVSGGKPAPGSLVAKYHACKTTAERVRFERNLSPEESKALGLALQREDSGG